MTPEALPPIEAVPEREPSPEWGFTELLFFAGILVASLVAGIVVTTFSLRLAGYKGTDALGLILGELLGYSLAFGSLAFYFRVQHNMRLLEALRWRRTWFSPLSMILNGVALSFGIVLLGALMRVPQIDMPIRKFLSDPVSFALLAIASVTLGPIFEEWIFRGLIQPVLARYLGVFGGILLTSAIFGVLHLPQYGNSWQHGVLLTIAGCGFGWCRHVFRSTLASGWMHCGYNLTLSVALWAATKGNFK